jgi:DNA-binding CsgD family transcriptional regulator
VMEQSRTAQLTDRQQQVLGCVAAGLTDREIASRLAISPRTVRMHCDAIRARLAVSRRRHMPAAFRLQSGRDPLELYEQLPK